MGSFLRKAFVGYIISYFEQSINTVVLFTRIFKVALLQYITMYDFYGLILMGNIYLRLGDTNHLKNSAYCFLAKHSALKE